MDMYYHGKFNKNDGPYNPNPYQTDKNI